MIKWIKSLLPRWQIVQWSNGKYYVRKSKYYADKASPSVKVYNKTGVEKYCGHSSLEEARETLKKVLEIENLGKDERVIE